MLLDKMFLAGRRINLRKATTIVPCAPAREGFEINLVDTPE